MCFVNYLKTFNFKLFDSNQGLFFQYCLGFNKANHYNSIKNYPENTDVIVDYVYENKIPQRVKQEKNGKMNEDWNNFHLNEIY